MARVARVVAVGYPHHVTQRGNRRLQTFFGEEDYRAYLKLMAKWCRQFGKEVLLLGNIDKRVLRDGCSKADIEREVMSKVPQLVEQGGYSPFVDHSVPPDVPFENFKYYVDLVQEACTLG